MPLPVSTCPYLSRVSFFTFHYLHLVFVYLPCVRLSTSLYLSGMCSFNRLVCLSSSTCFVYMSICLYFSLICVSLPVSVSVPGVLSSCVYLSRVCLFQSLSSVFFYLSLPASCLSLYLSLVCFSTCLGLSTWCSPVTCLYLSRLYLFLSLMCVSVPFFACARVSLAGIQTLFLMSALCNYRIPRRTRRLPAYTHLIFLHYYSVPHIISL